MTVQRAIDLTLEIGEQASGAVTPDYRQFVTFSCNDRRYGVDIMAVREIWSLPLQARPSVF